MIKDYWCTIGPVVPWDCAFDSDSRTILVRYPNYLTPFTNYPPAPLHWEQIFFEYDLQGRGEISAGIGECPISYYNDKYTAAESTAHLRSSVEWNEDFTKYVYIDYVADTIRIINRDGSGDTLVYTPADPPHEIVGYYNNKIVYITDANATEGLLDFDIWAVSDTGTGNVQLSHSSHYPYHAIWAKTTGKVYYLNFNSITYASASPTGVWVVDDVGTGLTELYFGNRYMALAGINSDETKLIVTIARPDLNTLTDLPYAVDIDFDRASEEYAFPTLIGEFIELLKDVAGINVTATLGGPFNNATFFNFCGNSLILSPDKTKYVVRSGTTLGSNGTHISSGTILANELDGYDSTECIYSVQPADNTPALLPIATLDIVNDFSFNYSGAISIDLTQCDIPDDYEHLLLITDIRSTTTLFSDFLLRFNDDNTAANYATYQNRNYYNSYANVAYATGAQAGMGVVQATTDLASAGSNSIIYIPEFRNTHVTKQAFAFDSYLYIRGAVLNYFGGMLASGNWLSTAAITKITFVKTAAGTAAISGVGFIHVYALKTKGSIKMVLSNPDWPNDFFEQQEYIKTLSSRLRLADEQAGLITCHTNNIKPTLTNMQNAWENRFGDSGIAENGRIQWFNTATLNLEESYIKNNNFATIGAPVSLFTREKPSMQVIGHCLGPNNDGGTSILFSGIPQTYRHLMLKGCLQDVGAGTTYQLIIAPNSNISAYCASSLIGYGGGATPSIINNTAGAGIRWPLLQGNTVLHGRLYFEFTLFDYRKENQLVADQALTYSLIGSSYYSTYQYIWFGGGGIDSAVSRAYVPVTSLLIDTTGTGFDPYSWLTLYGIHDYDTMMAAI